MPRSDDIVAEAKTWLGVKFRHCGRNRNGVDCAGLVIKVAHELGISTFDTNEYARRPDVREFVRYFKMNMDPVSKVYMAHGDVLLTKEVRFPAHCGILEVDAGGQRWFIHAYEPCGAVVREPLDARRFRDIIKVFRYREA